VSNYAKQTIAMYKQFGISYGSWDMKEGSYGFPGNFSKIHNIEYSIKATSLPLLWKISCWFCPISQVLTVILIHSDHL